MLNPIQGGKFMLIALHGLKLYAHFLYMNRSFMLIVIHGVKLYAHFYTWSEALCSLLFME